MNLIFDIDEPRDMRIHLEISNAKHGDNVAPLQGYWFELPIERIVGGTLEVNIPGREISEIVRVEAEFLKEGLRQDLDTSQLPKVYIKNRDFWRQQLRTMAKNAKPEEENG